jgi:hypothetical protein
MICAVSHLLAARQNGLFSRRSSVMWNLFLRLAILQIACFLGVFE